MMFFFHSSLALCYIAMVAGSGLLVWSIRHPEGEGSQFSKAVGAIVMTLALASILSTTYYGARFWYSGAFESPWGKDLQMMECMRDLEMKQQAHMPQ
jgi:hypothetical protein